MVTEYYAKYGKECLHYVHITLYAKLRKAYACTQTY